MSPPSVTCVHTGRYRDSAARAVGHAARVDRSGTLERMATAHEHALQLVGDVLREESCASPKMDTDTLAERIVHALESGLEPDDGDDLEPAGIVEVGGDGPPAGDLAAADVADGTPPVIDPNVV